MQVQLITKLNLTERKYTPWSFSFRLRFFFSIISQVISSIHFGSFKVEQDRTFSKLRRARLQMKRKWGKKISRNNLRQDILNISRKLRICFMNNCAVTAIPYNNKSSELNSQIHCSLNYFSQWVLIQILKSYSTRLIN